MTFTVDYNGDKDIPYGFTLIDECDFLENPHGNHIDTTNEDKQLTKLLYTDTSFGGIKVALP
jgi:hypothetical protein